MRFTCPRRRANRILLAQDEENLDAYDARGMVDQPKHCCSYCGSLSGDDFMDAIRTGVEIGPTDKSYKLYLHGLPSAHPGRLKVVGSSSRISENFRGWSDLTREEKKVVKRDSSYGDKKAWGYQFGPTPDTCQAKFYTHHLSEEQGFEFLELWRAKKISWGYPGHAYTRLYLPGPSTREQVT